MAITFTPLAHPFHFRIDKDDDSLMLNLGITPHNGIITPTLVLFDGSIVLQDLDDVYAYLELSACLPSKIQELDRVLYELEQPHLWSLLFSTEVQQYSCDVTVDYKTHNEEIMLHYGRCFNKPIIWMNGIEHDHALWCNFDLVGDIGADWYRKTLEFKSFVGVFQKYVEVLNAHKGDVKHLEAYVHLLSHHQVGLLEHYGQVQSIMSLPEFLQTNQYYAEMELLWN